MRTNFSRINRRHEIQPGAKSQVFHKGNAIATERSPMESIAHQNLAKPETDTEKLLKLIETSFRELGRKHFIAAKPSCYQDIVKYLQHENEECNPLTALTLAFMRTGQGNVFGRNRDRIHEIANHAVREHFKQIAKTSVIDQIAKLTQETVAKTKNRITDNDVLLFGETHSSVPTRDGKLVNPASDWLIANMRNLWNQGYRNFVFELPHDDDYRNNLAVTCNKPLEFVEAVQNLRNRLEKKIFESNLSEDPFVISFFPKIDEYLVRARIQMSTAQEIKRNNRPVKDDASRWQRILKAARSQGFQVSFADAKKKTLLEQAILEYPFLDILNQLKNKPGSSANTLGFQFLEFYLQNRDSKIYQLRDISLASHLRAKAKSGKTIALLGANHTTNMPYSGHYSTAQILRGGHFSADGQKTPIPVTAIKLEFAEENNGFQQIPRFLEDFHNSGMSIGSPTIFRTQDSPLLSQKGWYLIKNFHREPRQRIYKLLPSKVGEDICNAVITFPRIQVA